jgi:hypothetical protein
MRIAFSVGVVAFLAFDLYVMVRVTLAQEYSRQQKALQLLIIWLIPFFGALFCNTVLSSDRKGREPRDSRFVRDEGSNPPGIGQGGTPI